MGLIVFSRWANNFFSAHTNKIKALTITASMVSYILLGAITLISIEGSNEVTRKEKVASAKRATLDKYKNIPEEVLDTFTTELKARGIEVPTDDDTHLWTLANTAMLCAILLTTIGYGHLVPQTNPGKIFVMLYSSIGIPFTLFVLSWGLDKVKAISNYFKINCYYRLGHHLSTFKVLVIHFCIMWTLVFVPFFLFPGYVFMKLEKNWSYLDSIYFIFISCTTIGLGDFVPGKDMQYPMVELYRAGTIIFLVIALILAMYILNFTTDFILMVIEYKKTGKEPILEPEEENMPIRTEDSSSYGSVTVILPEENNNKEKKPLLP